MFSGHIDHLGTGTTDIIEACVAKGLRAPEFVQTEEFRTIIWRKCSIENRQCKTTKIDSVNATKIDSVNARTSDSVKSVSKVERVKNRIIIKKILMANPYVTIRELAQMVGITERNINTHIQKLKERDGLRRVGSDKCGHWEFE